MESYRKKSLGSTRKRGAALLKSKQWSDCSFLVGSEPNQSLFHTHKLILAMASPVFEAMFYGGVAEKSRPIRIIDIQPDTFKALINYIYADKLNIESFDQACDLYYAAKKYLLCHLLEKCTEKLRFYLTTKNAGKAYEFANLFDETDFMDKCMQLAYKQLYETLNDKEPLKIVRACATRWLSFETAVQRVLSQWVELKLHFEIARSYEKCYAAELLYCLYQNPINEVYLLYIHSVLQELQTLIKVFQMNNADPTKLLKDMMFTIESLGKRVLNPLHNLNVFEMNNLNDYVNPNPYLGFKFERKMAEIKEANDISVEQEKEVRSRCINFTLSLLYQLKQRLPENYKILSKIDQLSVSNTLRQLKENLAPLAIAFGLSVDVADKIEMQWQKIALIKWEHTNSTMAFWAEVLKYKDAGDINCFEELSFFTVSILSLPWSNGEVERVFSQLNIVKNKIRNRLGLETTNAILCIRAGLRRLKKCCHTYELPKEVLKKVRSLSTYKSPGSNFDEPMPGTSSTSDNIDLMLELEETEIDI